MRVSSRRRLAVAAAIVSMSLIGGPARGGYKVENPVFVGVPWEWSPGIVISYAYGYAGSARNAPDGNQYIYCATFGTSSVSCGAVDSASNFTGCTSWNPDMIQVGSSATSDSFIYFSTTNGECEYLQVDQLSYAPPKQP